MNLRFLFASSRSRKVISLDLEGVNVGGAQGEVTLAVVGLASGHVYLFDLVACPQIVSHGRLADLLESPDVLKVLDVALFVSP